MILYDEVGENQVLQITKDLKAAYPGGWIGAIVSKKPIIFYFSWNH